MVLDINYVSFPGLGISEFKIDTVAFNLFGRDIAWYGVIICFAMIIAFFISSRNASKKEGIVIDSFLDYVIFMIPFGVIGARTMYVLTTLNTHIYDSFYDVIAIWEGGIAVYGSLIFGILTVYVVSKIKKQSSLKVFDALAPGVMIAQAIGRWGNFVNQEAFGTNTTLPWGMYSDKTYSYLLSCKNELSEYGISVDPTLPVHPTFLYESLWNIIGFIISIFIYRKKKFNGQIFYFYLAWYGLGRTFIELLRTDSLMIGNLRASSLIGVISFLVGVTGIMVGRSRLRVQKSGFGEYAEDSDEDSEEADSSDNDNVKDVVTSDSHTEESAASDEGGAEESEGENKDTEQSEKQDGQ